MNHDADWLDQINDWRDGVSASAHAPGEGSPPPRRLRFASRLSRHGGARLPAPGQFVDLDKLHDEPSQPDTAPESQQDQDQAPPASDSSPKAGADTEKAKENGTEKPGDDEQPAETFRDAVRRRIHEWAAAIEKRAGVAPPESEADAAPDPKNAKKDSAPDKDSTTEGAGDTADTKDKSPADKDNEPNEGQKDKEKGEEKDKAAENPPHGGRLRRWFDGGTYQRPAPYDTPPAPRKSLIQWWQGREAPTRWILYNGTALGAGLWVGLPQWFTGATAYLVNTYDTWHDWHLVPYYAAAAAIWYLDQRTRNWIFLFALPCRIPLISMVVGCLLYGSPDLHV